MTSRQLKSLSLVVYMMFTLCSNDIVLMTIIVIYFLTLASVQVFFISDFSPSLTCLGKSSKKQKETQYSFLCVFRKKIKQTSNNLSTIRMDFICADL